MTFQNVKLGRVVQNVVFIFIVSMVLYFALSCLTLPLLPAGLGDQFNNILDAYTQALEEEADQETVMTEVEGELDILIDEYGTELYIQSIIQWTLGVLVTLFFARRAGRDASSAEQAVGYGVMVGLGSMMTFGLLCVMCNLFAQLLVQLMFMALLVGAGYLGGRFAATNLDPAQAVPDAVPDVRRDLPTGLLTQPGAAPPGGGDPSVFYNMGVAAAMGGRREEARQHFTRTLQMQPRNVAAWLQLANLAETPEQAWGYIQQARSISPNDPSVQEAVNVIWPQVHARSLHSPDEAPPRPADEAGTAPPPPSAQPPYPGGEMDDPDIPRTMLPGSDEVDSDDESS